MKYKINMKYINKFSTNADYQAFKEGEGYVTPYVCYIEETNGIKLQEYIAPIITFTINGIEYQAEEGMTWENWCNSEYNTRDFWCSSNNVYIDNGTMISGETPSDVICEESMYTLVSYLTILALEDGLTASLSSKACQYCVNGDGNWIDLPAGTATQAINEGQTLSFKGNLNPHTSNGIGTFSISKKCNLEGNCMSMLFGDNAMNNNSLYGKSSAFYRLFYNCPSIIQVSESFLPATTLSYGCYNNMFYACTNLTQAPELPATTLANNCYENMFGSCSSLTVAPELPATTLNNSCYRSMFNGCTNLTTAPSILPATTLKDGCYREMFQYCKSLTVAPELPATTLANNCYYFMFYDCTCLNYIKMLATDISASNCLEIWVYRVSSTGTFVKNPSMTSLPSGNKGIPSGWTVVDDEE